MSVNAVTAGSGSAAALSAPGGQGLGKQDFLKLLIAQLRNQDPLKPMEDKEFIAQLAQFNSLEQLQQIRESMDLSLAAQLMGQAAGLIGKQVQAQVHPSGDIVSGVVSAVHLRGGVPSLVVNGQEVEYTDLMSVTATASDPGA